MIQKVYITRLFKFLFCTSLFMFSMLPTALFSQQESCNELLNLAGIYPCSGVNLMSSMTLADLGSTAANDIWGWQSPNTDREYALVGLNNGYAFVDVTDPINPVKIGNLPSHSGNSTWGDIKVVGNYAYLVSEALGHHIQVFDLLQLDAISNPPIIFDEESYSIIEIADGNAHNIEADEESEFVYSMGTRSLCSGGLVAHDVSDPENPIYAGCFSEDGYSHDAMCFVYRGEDTEHIGKQICIGFNEDTYTIVDMTDKQAPVQISRGSYSGESYTHQGWVTDDHKYLLLDDELDEQSNGTNTSTYVFDISDLDNPTYFYTYVAESSSIDHNMYVKGNYAYQANYAAGLRVLDLSNIGTENGITEAAYFDFYPLHNLPIFISVWSSYPYFKSGNIIVSDAEQGLFVVQVKLPHFVIDLPEGGIRETDAATSVSYEIDLTAYDGFSEVVDLSVSNLPAGVTASFSNNKTSSMGRTTLTLDNLEAVPTGNYHLMVSGTAPGSPDQEIAIGFRKKPNSLPISLVRFDAIAQKESIQLSWEVASQVNHKGYEIWRSTEPNKGFNPIGWVNTMEEKKIYHLEDTEVKKNTNYYYQLREEDQSGKSTASNIVQARITTNQTTFSLVPNPAKDLVNIHLSSPLTEGTSMEISLMSLEGKMLYQGTYSGLNTSYPLSLEGLPKGIYLVKLQSDNGVEIQRLATL